MPKHLLRVIEFKGINERQHVNVNNNGAQIGCLRHTTELFHPFFLGSSQEDFHLSALVT